ADTLPEERIGDPDWLVVDSYVLEHGQNNQVAKSVPTLAIIDGDDRDLNAALYLDQNLGAERQLWPPRVRQRRLAGSRFALVRDGVLKSRQSRLWRLPSENVRIVCFMGGTDPLGASRYVVDALARIDAEFDAIIVTDSSLAIRDSRFAVHAPTSDLPEL